MAKNNSNRYNHQYCRSKYYLYSLLFLLVLLGGCKPFHDTTARYNAYFLANERLTEVETSMFGNPKNNYNEVLDVLISLDTNAGKSQKANLDYVIKMASLPIQFHKMSKWVDDCYILIGKSRLYQGDFANAIQTFKYVNTQSEDDNARHEALNMLMYTFLETGELSNFELVKRYIQRENKPFNTKNTRFYHVVNAHHYRKLYDLEMTAGHLEIALSMSKKKAERRQIAYILAQIYDQTGQEDKAYQAYNIVLRSKPNYEMALIAKSLKYTKQNYKNLKEFKRAERYFKKSIKAEKNFEYRDRLYYEYANLNLKVDSVNKALDLLEESIETSTQNTIQKAYSYLKKGELLYEKKKNYELAAEYYEKAAKSFPKTAHNYNAVQERNNILQEYVKYLKKVRAEDRLLALAAMSFAQVDSALEKEIQDEKDAIIAQKSKERLLKKKQRKPAESSLANIKGISKNGEATWAFYSDEAMAAGNAAFIKKWGPRKLEDNWRRSNKPISFDNTASTNNNQPNNIEQKNIDNQPKNKAGKDKEEDNIFAKIKSKEDRLKEIPKSEEDFTKVKKRLETALFPLGKIYCFKLKEYPEAINTLEYRLYTEFPQADSTPEALYILYLMCLEYPGCNAEHYKNILIEKYPNTFFAKVLINPNYIEEKNREDKFVNDQYKKAFELYKSGNYAEAKAITNNLLQYQDISILDKITLLDAMLLGHLSGNSSEYYQILDDFPKKFPKSDLKDFAKNLQKSIEGKYKK